MSDQLTPARLRALIAAATPGPWIRHGSHFYAESDRRLLGTIAGSLLVENADLFLALVNNAPALADALAKVKIYEEALVAIDSMRGGCEETHCWNVAEQALIRAAKEAADAM